MTTMSLGTPDAPTVPAPPVPAEAPTAPAPVQGDPAAPYGRTPSGRARNKPLSGKRGRPRGTRTSVIGAKGSQRPAAPKNKPVDYRPAILRAVQVITMPLAFRAPVDAATIDHHVRGENTAENPGLARAISNLAAEQPQVAAVLDRLLQAGPYAEVIGAALPLAVQLLTNHGRLPVPVAERLGATDPAVIAAQLATEGERLAAQAA